MAEQTIHLFDYFRTCWRRRIGLALITLFITLGGIIYSYTLPTLYRVEAVIMPISPALGKASSEIPSVLINIPRFLRDSGPSTGTNLMMYLKSKALQIQVVKALNLAEQLFPKGSPQDKGWTEAEKLDWAATILSSRVSVDGDRVFIDLIKIAVVHSDPQFATRLVRQYLVELQNFITRNSLTQAKRYRFFLEEQQAEIRKEMLEMGKTIANLYKDVSVESGKQNVPIGIRTEEGVRNFKDYEEFKAHFNVLQKGGAFANVNEDIPFVKDVPNQTYLKYMTTQQEILEANYASLTQSYQIAKLEEAKQEPSFQVLSEPIPPRYKFYPKRKKIAMISLLLGVLAGALYVFYREFYQKVKQHRLTSVPVTGQEEVA